ncbi:MAG: hypothetical protein A2268_02645 [Candidatus Raymondbacteria bacterium RifOxyA12_full_50_37]|uniref:Right handed beta helix domain-containing protein n=1 Tax=Candidatus Raymondbacteria bacterium RIFOXYD12_FULL_49_13 TaxID=1817890 RepID=A0A1F7F5P1_UNCRA|nr:MAG: hypothetical protein A2268_02645 [Candidatus Raymondbacteria bacterium RifOxyA12_full_50_37]OGJ89167.1 MAG: hypothetical protein A2248_11465 [Candidatus Raymondbacteria bacterium RIFOXYA2_FULL_49_16]OGJ96649.1 MAG: hypothetical protein A2453_06580 [Candidatus Raymondbacteria bacterium RIFOXYC2_FULL_50_21]OGK01961.1 MAG: hypothetical protein A2519_17685 [Candidatus Raymondbacteria bacterium RIFOXYD12_FULL_49_13]OGP42209.1 MAG: hypothetical protein A2324_02305 [Candidatus Raymondbacteria 
MKKALFLVLASASLLAAGENTLGGEQTGVLGPGAYVAADDIVVPENSSLVIRAGTVVLFDGFYSLVVKGTLLVEGSQQNRVVFTSVKDANYGGAGAAALDWNHIVFESQARGCVLANASIFYGTDGIAALSADCDIDNVFLGNNGVNRISVKGRQLEPDATGVFAFSGRAPAALPAPIAPAPQPAKKKSMLPMVIAGSVVVAAVAAVYWFVYRAPSDSDGPLVIPDPPAPSGNTP